MKRVIYILLMLIPSSCEKETYEYFNIPDSVKAWGLYQVGSYWIYKDEDTGQLDSVYVYEVKRTTKDEVSDKLHHHIYEQITIKIRNSINENKTILLGRFYWENIYKDYDNYTFKENFDISKFYNLTETSSLQVNSIFYNDIVYFKDNNDNEMWVAKENWIVKQKVHSDPTNFSTKTLIRNKIIR